MLPPSPLYRLLLPLPPTASSYRFLLPLSPIQLFALCIASTVTTSCVTTSEIHHHFLRDSPLPPEIHHSSSFRPMRTAFSSLHLLPPPPIFYPRHCRTTVAPRAFRLAQRIHADPPYMMPDFRTLPPDRRNPFTRTTAPLLLFASPTFRILFIAATIHHRSARLSFLCHLFLPLSRPPPPSTCLPTPWLAPNVSVHARRYATYHPHPPSAHPGVSRFSPMLVRYATYHPPPPSARPGVSCAQSSLNSPMFLPSAPMIVGHAYTMTHALVLCSTRHLSCISSTHRSYHSRHPNPLP